jgi:UDP-glucuronate 4-epimerase
MSNILVTGAAGFIGSHLSEKLIQHGNQVIGIDNFDPFYSEKIKLSNINSLEKSEKFKLHKLDITNIDSFKSIDDDIELVVHLAAKAGVLPSIKDPVGYLRTNIIGTQNVLEFMKERSIDKLIFGSSSSIYGNNKKVPFEEFDSVDHPVSPYAQSKKSSELLNYTYHHLYNFDIVNLRFFTVYGPRQRPDLAIHKFIDLIQNNKPITMFGDGTSSRDYTFIDDIVEGILSAINYVQNNSNIYEIINVGGNNPIKLIDLINKIYSLTDQKPNINKVDFQMGDVNQTYANINKAKKLLNYNPSIDFDEGLRKFINWHNKST